MRPMVYLPMNLSSRSRRIDLRAQADSSLRRHLSSTHRADGLAIPRARWLPAIRIPIVTIQ
jgi:hypothetical protein